MTLDIPMMHYQKVYESTQPIINEIVALTPKFVKVNLVDQPRTLLFSMYSVTDLIGLANRHWSFVGLVIVSCSQIRWPHAAARVSSSR